MLTINVKLPQEQIDRIDARMNTLHDEVSERLDHIDLYGRDHMEREQLVREIQGLEQRVQCLYLEHSLQIAALLEHFERQQKHGLEFVEVDAVASKVEVRRRAVD